MLDKKVTQIEAEKVIDKKLMCMDENSNKARSTSILFSLGRRSGSCRSMLGNVNAFISVKVTHAGNTKWREESWMMWRKRKI